MALTCFSSWNIGFLAVCPMTILSSRRSLGYRLNNGSISNRSSVDSSMKGGSTNESIKNSLKPRQTSNVVRQPAERLSQRENPNDHRIDHASDHRMDHQSIIRTISPHPHPHIHPHFVRMKIIRHAASLHERLMRSANALKRFSNLKSQSGSSIIEEDCENR